MIEQEVKHICSIERSDDDPLSCFSVMSFLGL